MQPIKPNLNGVRVTALVTLYLRWKDSQDSRSLLEDRWAGPAVQSLDFDFAQLAPIDYTRFTIGARSRVIDNWVADYLADNADAVAIDLGSGFDSRVFRINPPASNAWYDIDFPDVITIRDALYPDRPGHASIGASVTDPQWLDRVPDDRPVVVIADSVLMFLPEDEVAALFRRIVERFPSGEIVFTAYSSMVKEREAKRGAGPFFERYGVSATQWTLDEPSDVEKFDARLTFVERLSQVDPRLHRRAPLLDRLMCMLICTTRSGKYAGSVLRYRFSSAVPTRPQAG